MYSFAICDDDADFCHLFKTKLNKIADEKKGSCSLSCYYDVDSFLTDLNSNKKFDLIFLDVMLGKSNGIEFAKKLRNSNNKTDIIFISNFNEFAVDSFDAEPLYYLLKSTNSDKLEAAVDRFLSKNKPNKVQVKTAKGSVLINLSEIAYFEIFSHDIDIHLTDGSQRSFRGTLKNIEESLPPMSFVKPHRSYLVNIECISGIASHNLILNNGVNIPLSKSMYGKIQNIMMEYLGKKNMFL